MSKLAGWLAGSPTSCSMIEVCVSRTGYTTWVATDAHLRIEEQNSFQVASNTRVSPRTMRTPPWGGRSPFHLVRC